MLRFHCHLITRICISIHYSNGVRFCSGICKNKFVTTWIIVSCKISVRLFIICSFPNLKCVWLLKLRRNFSIFTANMYFLSYLSTVETVKSESTALPVYLQCEAVRAHSILIRKLASVSSSCFQAQILNSVEWK